MAEPLPTTGSLLPELETLLATAPDAERVLATARLAAEKAC